MSPICRNALLFVVLFVIGAESYGQTNQALDLSPAKWIWYPSGRTLQNTFVLFRKEFDLEKQPTHAEGWILADSRYLLYVNGKRVQWGPAPSDPRWQEADPLDLASCLKPGKNVIACQVLYYGIGEGTWPIGKPGFLFKLDIDDRQIVSDDSWSTHLAKSWVQGQYKRWFLRTLQENFDARRYPYGWNTLDFETDNDWLPAAQSNSSAAKPSICNAFNEYQWGIFGDARNTEIRKRSIPMMRENDVKVQRLIESAWVKWIRPADEYFDVMTANAYEAEWMNDVQQTGHNAWTVPEHAGKTAALTFDFSEQSVGWPYFTIEAPAGTIVELLVHEAHQPGGPVIINSHFNAWSRFVCKEGVNRFETFDFESFRWLQLHIRNYSGEVKISEIGMRRRQYDFYVTPQIKVSDPALQRLMDASVNMLYNSAQETVVDGMARERQQYSGDGSHQLHPLYQVFGETRLPARFIRTFSQGLTLDGYFLDSWPAFDRLARIMERQMQLTGWGPILDHGVGFCFDNYYYYQYTGDTVALRESFPRLLRFFDYLTTIRDDDGLLRVENLGIPSVWIDHNAYRQQRHKQCAFNLYTSAMYIHALAPLCRIFGETAKADAIERSGKDLLAVCIEKFWSPEEQTFVNNLPWLTTDGAPRYCDRSLATAVLFGQCPDANDKRSVEILETRPENLGISYPCNAVWRLWALCRAGKIGTVLSELRRDWATMQSVILNNTIQESWHATGDSNEQWSHCAAAPIIMMYQGIAGIKPLTPGYDTFQIRPQLGDLKSVELVSRTIKGDIVFKSKGDKGNRELALEIPEGTTAFLLLDSREKVNLKSDELDAATGLKKYRLSGGVKIKLKLKFL